jgi:hypothetical protein
MDEEDAVAQSFINEPWQESALEPALIEQLRTEELLLRCLIARIVAPAPQRGKHETRRRVSV